MAERVERYEPDTVDAGLKMLPEPDGQWVRYSDYEKLEADRDRRLAHWRRACDERDRAEDRVVEVEAQRDQARAQDAVLLRQEVLEEVLTERVFAVATAALIRERDHEGPGCGCDQCLAISALRAAVSLLATLDPSGGRSSRNCVQAEGYRRIVAELLTGNADRDPAAFLERCKQISQEQAQKESDPSGEQGD